MGNAYITFRSVTHAQRGERLLQQHGIRCALQRTPRWMEEQGCGYCLRLRAADLTGAGELLESAGIHYRRRYLMNSQGKLTEAES